MRKYLSFLLCLLIGANVFAQNQVLKAVAATSNQNFKVAETPLMTKVSNTQAKSLGDTYLENEAFYTTYDLQSNNLIANRMYQAKDGSVAVVTTMSTQEYDANFADRGTGYNFYKNGKILEGGDQFQKIEANATGADMRTGWPTIAPYGAEGEIMVCHTGNGLVYYTRTKAGEGIWDGPHAIPNPNATKIEGIEEGLTLSWARVVTTGENNDVVHIFAAATGTDNYYQFYVRSTDLQEWDVQLSPLAMDDLAIGFYSADDYAVASNGNYVSVVYCTGWTSHVMLYESNDQGLTWTSRMVWECPIHGLDWATDENSLIDQCYGPAHASVAIGKDGVSHVVLSVGVYSREELNNGYLVYYGLSTDGIAYWNDTTAWEYEVNGVDTIAIPSPIRSVRDTELKHALRLWWEDPEQEGYIQMDLTNFCAWMPPHVEEGYNAFNPTYQYTGSEGGTAGDYQSSFGLSAYPSIAVDVYGNLAISWCSPDLNRDMYNGVYYMRTPFVKYKPANVPYWWQVNDYGISMYEDFIHTGDEATFITAVSGSVKPNEFWFSCLSDDTPGFHTGSITSQPNISTSIVNVFKFTPAEGYEGDEDFDNPTYPEQPSNHWNPDESLYANNMTIITTVEIDGVEAASTDLEIGAFCNGELRGSSRLQYVASPANRYECFLMVYGNAGDDITFRMYDHSTGLESELKSSEVVDFEVNGTVGDVINPYTIKFTSKHWIVDPSLYANNMTLIATLEIDGE